MAGQEVEDEDLDAVSKDIMTTIDEDGDGDVTKVNNFRLLYNFLFLCYTKYYSQDEFVKHALKRKFQ